MLKARLDADASVTKIETATHASRTNPHGRCQTNKQATHTQIHKHTHSFSHFKSDRPTDIADREVVAIHAGTDRCYSDLSPRYTPGHQNTDRNAVSSPDRKAHQSNLQEITRQLMVQSAVAGYAVVDDTPLLNVCFCVCVGGEE